MATPQFLTWSILDPGGVSLHNQNFWQSESYFATPGSWQLKGLLGLKVGRVATLYKAISSLQNVKILKHLLIAFYHYHYHFNIFNA